MFAAVVLAASGAGAACEQMLGLSDPPIADLLAARPEVAAVRYAPTSEDGCEVGADLVIRLAPQAELDWLDIVLTRRLPNGGTEYAHELCAMVGETVAASRTRLIPGQRYIATVAAYDVEGRKSEPVSLELTGPGIGSREWMAKAPACPTPYPTERRNRKLPKATTLRQPWSRAVVGTAAGAGLVWVLWLLVKPRHRRRPDGDR
ncbi:MAG: hypothetical protein KJO07_14595 [Deltaproteobacteria bacterium]|nr:hypothetical protein [Deltaproteobacteria bacterium]